MEEVKPDVIEESLPSEDVNEEEQSTSELEEATSQEAAQEEQTVPYDRFKEVIDERNHLRELSRNFAERKQQGETVQQIEDDPYKGMDAETEKFYRDLDKRTQRQVETTAKKIAAPIMKENEAIKRQLSVILEKDFRKANEDVPMNSKEEGEIAALIRMGVDPEKAAWAVMGPKRVESAKTVKKQQTKEKVQKKAEANLESGGIPAQNGLPQTKLDFRDDLDKQFREAGL